MPLPRVFSSRRPTRFPGPTGNQVADVAVVFVRAGGFPVAAPLAGRRAAVLVVRRALPVVAAGNGVDWRIVVRHGGDGVAPPPRVQLVSIFRHLVTVLEILRNDVDHVGGEAEQERGHEVCAGGRVRWQQRLHLPHHLRRFHVADFGELMQLERSGPAVHGVPGHKQCFQLLVGIRGVLIYLRQAVVDAAADVRGQGGEQVTVFC